MHFAWHCDRLPGSRKPGTSQVLWLFTLHFLLPMHFARVAANVKRICCYADTSTVAGTAQITQMLVPLLPITGAARPDIDNYCKTCELQNWSLEWPIKPGHSWSYFAPALICVGARLTIADTAIDISNGKRILLLHKPESVHNTQKAG